MRSGHSRSGVGNQGAIKRKPLRQVRDHNKPYAPPPGMAEADAKFHPTHSDPAKAMGLLDRFMKCVGSGMVHPEAWLELRRGRKSIFSVCPLPRCRATCYLNGPDWMNKEALFLTRDQVAKINPDALIL